MRQRDRDRVPVLIALADTLAHALRAEQPAGSEPAHGHDHARTQQPQLVVAPALAGVLLARRGRAVAAPRRRLSGVAAGDRRAVERRVELVLVHREPAAQRLPGPTAPRPALRALDDPRRLA